MHRQASFYAGLCPDGTKIGADGDVNFFYLPSPAGGPKYMLGAGDLYAAGSDKPETFAVLKYTGSADYQIRDRQQASASSRRTRTSTSATITDPFIKQLSELQAGADVFRFDGSDLMPGAVGPGTFWTEITAVDRRWQHRRLREQRRGQLAEELSRLRSRLTKHDATEGVGLRPGPLSIVTVMERPHGCCEEGVMGDLLTTIVVVIIGVGGLLAVLGGLYWLTQAAARAGGPSEDASSCSCCRRCS